MRPWWEECDSGVVDIVRVLSDGRVGDLLEAGERREDPSGELTRRWQRMAWKDPASTIPESLRIMGRYAAAVPDALGMCGYMHRSGDRIGRCLLPDRHPSWARGVLDSIGERHRVYLFSARDSAAMLESMRKRLTEPMEEL